MINLQIIIEITFFYNLNQLFLFETIYPKIKNIRREVLFNKRIILQNYQNFINI